MNNSIEDRVLSTIKRVLTINHDCSSLNTQSSILHEPIAVDEVELVYIVMELMEEFGIRFDAEDFDNYAFDSIETIICCVKKHMKKAQL